jgi:xylan 1,4-beta-xylosidase
VQSFGKSCAASSSLANHAPALAADENCRTWWSAQTGKEGEWFQMDLGKPTRVNAVQVNFAEQDCEAKSLKAGGEFQRYKLLASTDGKEWRTVSAPGARRELPGGVREAVGPHDYLPFAEPETVRVLKVENVLTPAGGKFALRDLRVFGPGDGQPPQPATNLEVTRHADDDRNATITWTPSRDADGYLIRFGLAPDKLFQTIQLQGGTNAMLTTHALNRGVKYSWRVDALSANGLTPSTSSLPK